MSSGPVSAPSRPDGDGKPEIPDYELIRLIGRGAYGDVWLARGLTGVYRAIKIVWRDRFADAQPFDREFRGLTEFAAISLVEARQMALLHVGRNDGAGFFYYVMEIADDVETGREVDPARYVPFTLRELRARRGRLPAAECVTIGAELARGLASLHDRQLVHRDIKPSNVIFVGGTPKLADIGLIAAVSDAMTFVGTEGFVPPEGPGTPAADVYSLGKLLYELSTGLDRNEFPRLPGDLGEIPDRIRLLELNEVILRACDSDATRRHHDATALLDELLLLQAGRSIRRLRTAERRLGRALRTAAILGFIAVVAGAGAWIERSHLAQETELRRRAEAALADLTRRTFYSASLARAQRALELGDLGSARRILGGVTPKAQEEDLRNFEWRALWAESLGDEADVLLEQGPPVEKLALSDDGRVLAEQGSDNRTTLWDTETLRPVRAIDGVHRLAAISRDGRWILGSNAAFALQRWSTGTGEADPGTGAGTNWPLGRSGAGGIVSVQGDAIRSPIAIRVWNPPDHGDDLNVRPVLENTKSWTYNLAVSSPDGASCALSAFYPRSAKVWRLQIYDLHGGRLKRERDYGHRISAIEFSSSGRNLAIAFADTNEITLEDSESGSILWRKTVETDVINAIAFSPDDRILSLGGRDPLIYILSASTGQSLNELRGHDGSVLDMAWSKSGAYLFSGGRGGDLRRWHNPAAASRKAFADLWAAPLQNHRACLSDDGALFAATAGDERIRIGATRAGAPAVVAEIGSSAPLSFDHGDSELLTLHSDGLLQRWTLASASEPRTEFQLSLDGGTILASSISADRRRLVVGDSRGFLQFWDVAARAPLGKVNAHEGSIWWTSLSPTGALAVSAGPDLMVRIWNAAAPALLAEWRESAFAYYAAFSSNGRWLAICFRSGEVEIRDLRSFRPMRRWKTDSSVAESVVFSNDDRRLFCGGANGAIHIYDTGDWRNVATLVADAGGKRGDPTLAWLAISAHDEALLAYREDGLVRMWQTRR